ncbi:23415_t:CDS:2, partial [Dentiscutata erythropus]
MDSLSVAVSSEICEQEGYEPDEYGSEFNSEEEVPTSSNYYSESSIILSKHQKTNVQDELVEQSSDTSKSSKVSKFDGSLLHSPAWKWFEKIYLDKVWHSRCNIEMAEKKLCDAKTTITRSFKTFLSKPHSITEQAIYDRAITEVVISQTLSFTFTEDKMFKRFAKIVDSRWAVPSREKQEKDAIADRKRLKAIMITEDEWTAVANIINILKPFNNITNYISGNTYPTMSIIYLTISIFRNALLKEFKDENDSTDKLTDFNSLINDHINIFNDEKILDEDEDAEKFESLAITTDLVKSIKKIMLKLFEKYYKFSDDKILFIATAIDPRCKNFDYEDAS